MKKILNIVFCYFILLLLSYVYLSSTAFSASFGDSNIEIEKYYDERIGKYVDVAAGEILVKFKPSVSAKSINNLNKTNQIDIVRNMPEIKVHRLSQSGGLQKIPVNDLLKAYKEDPSVEYAEPNFIVHHMATVPNDTSYSLQWGLQNISAEAGWDIERGSSEVTIAVIDTGMDMTHEDLSGKIWSNLSEVNGITGIDDDGNGYIDDRYGWDFVSADNDPDDLIHGHGTHVAGIAAASSNNNKGIAGVSWNSKIMVLRVLNSTGTGNISNIISGINYAANNGAKVINLSLGSSSESYFVDEAIQYAYGRGCVIAAAAGNDGNTIMDPKNWTTS